MKEDDIYSTIELDSISSTILNSLNAHIAILSSEGIILAFNNQWRVYIESHDENWSHPHLDVNILHNLQEPLTQGNDFALRLLLGIKEVLHHEKERFITKYQFIEGGESKTFEVTVSTLGYDQGALLVYEDVSAETQNHKYLKETRQKYETHFQNSLYGILITDEEQVVIEANNVACNLLETTTEAISFSNLSNYLQVDMDIAEIQKRINRQGNFIGEREVTTTNGRKLPVELSVNLFRNEEGKSLISWAFKDISEKKSTQQALKKSELQYKLQFNNTLEGTIIGRPDGQILTVNPAACKMLGYTAEELEGCYRDIIFDSEYPPNKEALRIRSETGSVAAEVIFTHKDGHKIPVEVSSVIFKSEDGTDKTIIHIKDISSRKAIQQQLINEKEFTDSAISSLPTAFFVFNKSGKLIRWNNLFENDLGYSNEELIDQNILDFVHPDDRPPLEAVLAGELVGKTLSFEVRCITKNGTLLHYLVRGTSFEQNGERYIVGGGLNRNDLKEAENEKNKNAELLNQLFSNSPIGIVLVDTDGNIQNTNKSFEQIFGFTSEELNGKNLNQTIVPDQMNDLAHSLSTLSFTGDSFQTESIRMDKNGNEVPVLVGGVPVEVDGNIIAIYGMYVDISERKKLENQILELLETEKKARIHMQEMFEEAPSAIAVVNGEDHRYTFVNDTYKKLVKKSNLLDQPVHSVLPEMKEQGIIDLLDICYTQGKTFQFNEKKIHFYDENNEQSHVHYLNFMYKPLRDDEGDIYGIFIEVVDVTEQVEARNIIQKSLAEKETLLNEVHHRVKNNLAIISGLIELEVMGTEEKSVICHLNSTQSRISTIAEIHELLYHNESLSHVSFNKYVESVMGGKIKKSSLGSNKLISKFTLDTVTLNVNQAIPAGMLLNEILDCLNEINATFGGKVESLLSFHMTNEENSVKIRIDDPSHLILELNKEKTNTHNALRLELIEVLLNQIHGKMDISESDISNLTITFPKREIKGPHSALND